MKNIFKFFLKYYLKYITKLVLFIHTPTIIAIAGSTNKTFVKEEIVRELKALGKEVRANPKSFNTEIGLPLAILHLSSGYNSYRKWLPVIRQAWRCLWQANFPKYLVLEMGVSDPGDMKYLLSIVRPRITVITDITQRYLESFTDMDELVGEYEYLVRATPVFGCTILNFDNPRIRSMRKLATGRIISFGSGEEADWRAEPVKKDTDGQSVKIYHRDKAHDHKIKKFGQHHVYALLAGLIIGKYVTQ